ncbi:MAG TPA: type II secretion system F family protein [Acetobacteraceae bacterium]|jgi:tight adherence protein C|nr:type II secretion system F family protein [Acetobacteraceae bacterium]
MSPEMLMLTGGLSALLMVACALLILQLVSRDDRVEQRLREANGSAPRRRKQVADPAAAGKSALQSLLDIVARLGSGIAASGLLSRKTLSELEQTLSSSGMAKSTSLGLFIGAKVSLVLLLPLVAQLVLHRSSVDANMALMLTLLAAVTGMMAPDMVIGKIRKAYLAKVEAGLPDTLDLLLICAQSGLSLQPAITRVELEIRDTYPAVAWELALTANELQFIADSRVALTNLGNRTGLDSLKRLTGTLIQTMQYGTPLSEALRAMAGEMRAETLTRYEARAARLPVLLTLPMIMFIMPCVFIVVGGPAVIMLIKAFQ